MTATVVPAPSGHPSAWSSLGLLVGGRQVHGFGEPLAVVNPADETEVARIAGASPEQVDDAVAAARRAFDTGPWSRSTPADRGALIGAIADAYERHTEALVEAIVTECGSPIALTRALQVGAPLVHLRSYQEAAAEDRSEDLGFHLDPVASRSRVDYRPVGVVGAITAYNYPLVLAVHKLGAALAAGCTVVLMASPRTPIATLLLGRIMAEAGVPDGVVNVLVGGPDASRRLTEHRDVDKVAFTGSPGVGTQVMVQAAGHLCDVVLELGGKSPAILLDDADFDLVVPELHRRYCRNAGQGCASPTRLLVPAGRWDDFIDISRATYPTIPVGDPRLPETIVGPLISAGHRDFVEAFVTEAVAAGAEVAAGGGRPDEPRGWYTNPALVVGIDNSWRIAQEEIFGPVAVALPYDTVDEAVAIANDTRYGLDAYLFSADAERALALAPRIRAGSVRINGGGGFRPDAPMGGLGISGVGREIGRWGIEEYLAPQHVQWPSIPG